MKRTQDGIELTKGAHFPPGRRRPRIGRGPRGIVLIVTLLSIVLIAALLAYMMNLGAHTNARIAIQNSADATAIGGATWIARSFNTVAMNNVAMAKYLSLINVLDAMPQAVSLTLKDENSFYSAFSDQINGANGRTSLSSLPLPDRTFVVSAVMNQGDQYSQGGLLAEFKREAAMLQPVDQALNHSGFDIESVTTYAPAAGGKGKLWSAITALDEYNQATMDNVSVLAQLSADKGGDANIGNTDAASFMVPVLPPVPALRARKFNDFRNPVGSGLLPDGVDNKIINRGPWDAIFGWRNFHYSSKYPPTGPGRWVPGSGNIDQAGNGNTGISGGSGTDNGYMSNPPNCYDVYGPKGRMYQSIWGFVHNQMRAFFEHRFYDTYFVPLANAKFGYMFDGSTNIQVSDPIWVADFDQVKTLYKANPAQVAETIYFAVEIKSKYPYTDGRFLTPGTWAVDIRHGGQSLRRVNGFLDPGQSFGGKPPATLLGNWVWRDQWSYTVNADLSIGIPEVLVTVDTPTGPQQHVVPQTIYHVDDFIFIAANIGKLIHIHNPSNFASTADLPAPTDFDHTQFCACPDKRLDFLTYLGVSSRKYDVPVMANYFKTDDLSPNLVGIAQAKVFNDHSWDLWTQMWHAKLEPVQNLPHWDTLMGQGASSSSSVPGLSQTEIQNAQSYLRQLEPLADPMMTH